MKKLISVLLCIAMVLSLAACDPAPQKDPGKDLYAQASQSLDKLSDVTLELLITTNTTVDGDEYSNQSTQTLTYQGRGTAEALIDLEESIGFSVHSPEYGTDDSNAEMFTIRETWHQDTLYTHVMDSYRYCAAMDSETAVSRYTPVVLLDSALYGSITSEQAPDGTLIHFAQPTAAESWALPQDAQLTEAAGTALVDSNGALTEMNYEITYTYGPTQVKRSVQSKPLATPKEASAPEDPDLYTTISYIDAPRTLMFASANLLQTDSMTTQYSDSIFSQAGGVVKNQSTGIDMHGQKKDTIAKIENSVYVMDYSTGETNEQDMEETYTDGTLTTVVNKGLPTTQSNISFELIREYAVQATLSTFVDMDFWEDVHITDLGSVYLMEYTLNENFGNTMQNSICYTLWNDPSLLLNLSSKYENAEMTAYLSVDKYTGIATASGYFYNGVHTIEGNEYILSWQADQSIEAPAKGAYQEITDKLPQEEEPETKPTPLFYHVTGKDGQEMWLLGTIHIGDNRTAYLPDEIRKAFTASDALALECDSEAFDRQLEQDDALSEAVSSLYFYTDGTQGVKESLEEDDYALAEKLLKAVGGNNQNMPYAKPYLWSTLIEQFYLRQAYQLHIDQGVEERLTDWAEEENKEIWEIESSMEQLEMLTGFSTELQILMLEDMLQYDAAAYQTETMELYELWCAGDEAALRATIGEAWSDADMTEEEKTKYKHLIEEYNKAMSYDRNEGMLDTAVEYLESGKVIFYAVGLAHLLDSTNGLLSTLQEAGYTVERVTFAG